MRYRMICTSKWHGTEVEEEIEGDFENEEEAIEAFGGYNIAMAWAVEEQGVEYWAEPIEEEE